MEFTGLLNKPDGDGPFPADVILVSGGGKLASHEAWGKTLAEWRYVSLLVNSFDARGGSNFLDTKAVDMTVEGFAAFTYLAARPDVQPENIGLLGFSMGGSFLFPVMRDDNKTRPDNVNYKAAVSYYPTCNIGYDYSKPILILFGDRDALSSLAQCQSMLNDSTYNTSGVSLSIYDSATHFFDSADYAKDAALRSDKWIKPMWFEAHHYDEAAHRESLVRTKDFLAEHLQ